MSVWSPDIAFDPDCETFADQASVMPRLIGNKIQPLLYGETFRMRTDVMKDFQDTAEKQEERWLVKFGKDVLADLHGVCPIVVLAAQEFYDKQDKLMETSSKIPPVPLNFQLEVPEHYGHETIMLTAGKSGEHIARPEVVICAGTRLVLNQRLMLCKKGDFGSGGFLPGKRLAAPKKRSYLLFSGRGGAHVERRRCD